MEGFLAPLVKFSSVGPAALALGLACAALAARPSATGAPLETGQPLAHERPEIEPALRIVAFGSSSTQGVGASHPSATYPAQMQAFLAGLLPNGRKVEVINRGIGGEDADDMAKRLDKDVIARSPDVVIWQTGSNDPVHHVPLDRFEHETRDGIAKMQAAGIDVILMEPQWCPKLASIASATDYRDVVRKLGTEMHVEVIRRSDLMHDWIRDGMLTRTQLLSADGLHMSDGGYQLLARSAARKVMKVEDIRPIAEAATTPLTAMP